MALFGSKKVECSKCGKKTHTGRTAAAICEQNHIICYKCGKKGFFKEMGGTLNPLGELKDLKDELTAGLDSSFKKTCVICESRMRRIKKEDLVGRA